MSHVMKIIHTSSTNKIPLENIECHLELDNQQQEIFRNNYYRTEYYGTNYIRMQRDSEAQLHCHHTCLNLFFKQLNLQVAKDFPSISSIQPSLQRMKHSYPLEQTPEKIYYFELLEAYQQRGRGCQHTRTYNTRGLREASIP